MFHGVKSDDGSVKIEILHLWTVFETNLKIGTHQINSIGFINHTLNCYLLKNIIFFATERHAKHTKRKVICIHAVTNIVRVRAAYQFKLWSDIFLQQREPVKLICCPLRQAVTSDFAHAPGTYDILAFFMA